MKKFAPIVTLLLLSAMRFAVAQQPKGKKPGQESTSSNVIQLPQGYKPAPSVATPSKTALNSDDGAYAPIGVRASVQMPSNTPDAVFTLPSPTGYQLPQSIKNMIMFGLNSEYNKQRSAQWREEYKYIFENKDELRRWLRNPVLNETLKGYAMDERGGIAGMRLSTQRMEMVAGWMEFLKTPSW